MSSLCPFPAGSHVNAYLRDSGGDEQDLSVPQQEAVIREFCEQNSLVLVHLFKDEARQGGSTVGREGEEVKIQINYYFFDGGGDILAEPYNYDVLPLGGILHSWRTWSHEITIKRK